MENKMFWYLFAIVISLIGVQIHLMKIRFVLERIAEGFGASKKGEE
jgi:hypothetical protein